MAYGFLPTGHNHGVSLEACMKSYYVDASQSAMYFGDPISALATGTANTAAFTMYGIVYKPGSKAAVRPSPAGGPLVGVMVGRPVNFTNPDQTEQPASTAGVIYVLGSKNVIFTAEEDSDSENITAAEGGFGNVNHISGTPDTVHKLSGYQLDSSSADTTEGLAWKIEGLSKAPHVSEDNAIGTNAEWDVTINDSFFSSPVAGV